MKKIIGLLLLSTCTVLAQREVQYQQYLLSPMAINPAMAGSAEAFRLTATFRRQWIQNIPGLPLTNTFSMDGRVGGGDSPNNSQNFWGLGLQGVIDRTSSFNNTSICGNMAYHYQLSDDQRISFGALVGVTVLPAFDIASQTLQNKARLATGLGVNYQTDAFWVGLSMPEVLSTTANLNGFVSITYPKPIFLHAGLYMQANDDIAFKPSVLISQKGEYHFNLQATYQNRGSATLAYRSVKTVLERQGLLYGLLSYNINKNVAVSYSYSSKVIEDLSKQRGIHELAFTFTPNPTN